MYLYDKNQLPMTFNGYFKKNSDFHNKPTRSAELDRIPITKNSLGERFVKKIGSFNME